MKFGTTMNYKGWYTARVFDTHTSEEDVYRPFNTVADAHEYVGKRHGNVHWLRWKSYKEASGTPYRPTKTHRHMVNGGR